MCIIISLQISACKTILMGARKYVRESHPVEVTAYEDGYAGLAWKAAETLDISVSSGELVLLCPASGGVIPTQLKDDTVSWTLGGFLR